VGVLVGNGVVALVGSEVVTVVGVLVGNGVVAVVGSEVVTVVGVLVGNGVVALVGSEVVTVVGVLVGNGVVAVVRDFALLLPLRDDFLVFLVLSLFLFKPRTRVSRVFPLFNGWARPCAIVRRSNRNAQYFSFLFDLSLLFPWMHPRV